MFDELTEDIIGSTQEVYTLLGAGHSEAVYETALELELAERNVGIIRRQVPCPIYYKGYLVGFGCIDILVNNRYVIELKTVSKLTNKDETQLKKYLAGMSLPLGLLVNFNPSSGEVETVECKRE